mmetsp:Transcript_19946/g.21674  ORF Transcript_19946/g.21674 Transcript_19946/m.21674 type:complete len:117 (+) Transcript_19946:1568-1918(+)
MSQWKSALLRTIYENNKSLQLLKLLLKRSICSFSKESRNFQGNGEEIWMGFATAKCLYVNLRIVSNPNGLKIAELETHITQQKSHFTSLVNSINLLNRSTNRIIEHLDELLSLFSC